MAGLQGRTLGGFQLGEQIASAGIAEVYRARPLAGNGREVVIKVIYPEFARYPSFLPNFQHIVQTAARLANHPHILPVVESGGGAGVVWCTGAGGAGGGRGGRLGRAGRRASEGATAHCVTISGAVAVSASRMPDLSSSSYPARWHTRIAWGWYTAT